MRPTADDLIEAIRAGRPEDIPRLVQAGADPREATALGDGALHHAVLVGDTRAIAILLSLGASPSLSDRKGRTPLHFAAALQEPLSVNLLLEHGADPNAKDVLGETPLHKAISRSLPPSTALLRHRKPDPVGTLSALLVAKASPNLGDKQGRTPLHIAAREGHVELCRLLGEFMANPYVTDIHGRNAFRYASDPAVANVLIEIASRNLTMITSIETRHVEPPL